MCVRVSHKNLQHLLFEIFHITHINSVKMLLVLLLCCCCCCQSSKPVKNVQCLFVQRTHTHIKHTHRRTGVRSLGESLGVLALLFATASC